VGDGVSLDRVAARLGLALLVVIAGYLLLQLTGRANTAYAARQRAGAALATPPSPETAVAVLTLRFDRMRAPDGLVEGWSTPEPGSGVWSDGDHAVLKLPAPPSPGPAEISLSVSPLVAPGRPFQRVVIRAGARRLGDWRLAEAGPTTLKVVAPAEARAPDGAIALQIALPDAESPARLSPGSLDARRLAIKLHAVTIAG
jgi:hypothetical protein